MIIAEKKKKKKNNNNNNNNNKQAYWEKVLSFSENIQMKNQIIFSKKRHQTFIKHF